MRRLLNLIRSRPRLFAGTAVILLAATALFALRSSGSADAASGSAHAGAVASARTPQPTVRPTAAAVSSTTASGRPTAHSGGTTGPGSPVRGADQPRRREPAPTGDRLLPVAGDGPPAVPAGRDRPRPLRRREARAALHRRGCAPPHHRARIGAPRRRVLGSTAQRLHARLSAAGLRHRVALKERGERQYGGDRRRLRRPDAPRPISASTALLRASGLHDRQRLLPQGQPERARLAAAGRRDPSWEQEISLDLDTVSAICPNCHILLVEANSTA